MRPNFRELEENVYKYTRMVDAYAVKDIIKYASEYVEMMWMFGKNLDYKVSVASDETGLNTLYLSWKGVFNQKTKQHDPLHAYSASYHERVIGEALQSEIDRKFPDTRCKIIVTFPSK